MKAQVPATHLLSAHPLTHRPSTRPPTYPHQPTHPPTHPPTCLTPCRAIVTTAGLLADSLRYNSTIVSCDVSSNSIGSLGLMSLGAILPHNSSLCSLSLAANRLDSECVDFLVFGLYRNEALTYLDIGDNNFTANNMRKLGRALQCSSM